jgi:hypothetical protein
MEVNRLWKKWQESCAVKGKNNPVIITFYTDMRNKRRDWIWKIKQIKALYWKDFLDTASSGGLWKAAVYMELRDSYANIPPLKTSDREAVDNEDKA